MKKAFILVILLLSLTITVSYASADCIPGGFDRDWVALITKGLAEEGFANNGIKEEYKVRHFNNEGQEPRSIVSYDQFEGITIMLNYKNGTFDELTIMIDPEYGFTEEQANGILQTALIATYDISDEDANGMLSTLYDSLVTNEVSSNLQTASIEKEKGASVRLSTGAAMGQKVLNLSFYYVW